MADFPVSKKSPHTELLQLSPEEYLKGRLSQHLSWYNRRYIRNKNLHYLLRVLVVIGGLVVAWLASSQISEKDIIVSLLGLAIAISAALESIFQFRENWKVSHSIALNIDNEKTKFQLRSGEYNDLTAEDAFKLLVEKVENYTKQSTQGLVELLTVSSKDV